MTATSNNQIDVILTVLRTIIDTIAALPEGIPGGTLYAALMTQGCSKHQFDRLMQIAVDSGKVEQRGYVFYPGK